MKGWLGLPERLVGPPSIDDIEVEKPKTTDSFFGNLVLATLGTWEGLAVKSVIWLVAFVLIVLIGSSTNCPR